IACTPGWIAERSLCSSALQVLAIAGRWLPALRSGYGWLRERDGMPATDPNKFIIDLLRAVHNATGARRPPAWTAVEKGQAKLGTTNNEALDVAIRLAGRKGWLRADGDPASSMTLTVQGLSILESSSS